MKPGKTARERVSAHMNILVAAALVTTATAAADCGYGVVDPLPPPSSCPDIAKQLIVTATWVDDMAGGTELEIRVTRPANRADITFEEWKTSTGSSLVPQTLPDGFAVRLKVDATAVDAAFDVDVHCSGDGGVATTLRVDVTVTSTRTVGTTAKTNVYELF
ncbi:MAG: hypothetical protein U0414_09975 [Polyangiaceae bacterium]